MAFECELCELNKLKQITEKYVLGNGRPTDEVMFIGEAPAKGDPNSGIIYYAGDYRQILNEMLEAAGLVREKVFLTSLVKCRPPLDRRGVVNKPEEAHIEACFTHLNAEINAVKPKWIVLMGAAPIKFLLGKKTLTETLNKIYDSADFKGITFALSGETKSLKKKVEGVEISKTLYLNKPGMFKIICVNSPVSIARDPSKKEETLQSMRAFKDTLEGKIPEKVDYRYKFAYSEPEIYDLLQEVYAKTKTETRMVYDLETSGFYWYKRMFNPFQSTVLGVAFSFKAYEAYGVTLRPEFRSQRVIDLLKSIMESDIPKCGHNGKFDNIFCRAEWGIQVKNYAFDTLIAAFALNQEAELGLDKLAPALRPDLGRWWDEVDKTLHAEYGHLKTPDDKLVPYNCKDVDATMSLWAVFEDQLKKRDKEKLFREILMPHARELEDMEFVGIKVDVPAITELGKSVLQEVIKLEEDTLALVKKHPPAWGNDIYFMEHEKGITHEQYKSLNLNSPKQLVELLYHEMALPISVKTDKTKQPAVNEEALKKLEDIDKTGFVKSLLKYREINKRLSTYIGWEKKEDGTEGPYNTGNSLLALVDKNSRIHTNFKIAGAATGRLSSASPNIQNQPKQKMYRDLFLAEEGWKFINSDFAGLELRVIANLSGDVGMIDAFNRGVDPHSATASAMFNIPVEKITKDSKERKAGKTINFGVAYGKGALSLSEELKIPKEEAENYLKEWARVRPEATKWFRGNQEFVRQNAFIRYSMNRERPLWGIRSNDDGLQGNALRQALNTPVQGTGADCLSISIIRIGNRLRQEFEGRARILIEVHDEIIVEAREDCAEQVRAVVIEEMRKPMPMLNPNLGLDVDCEIKSRWGDGMTT